MSSSTSSELTPEISISLSSLDTENAESSFSRSPSQLLRSISPRSPADGPSPQNVIKGTRNFLSECREIERLTPSKKVVEFLLAEFIEEVIQDQRNVMFMAVQENDLTTVARIFEGLKTSEFNFSKSDLLAFRDATSPENIRLWNYFDHKIEPEIFDRPSSPIPEDEKDLHKSFPISAIIFGRDGIFKTQEVIVETFEP